jgi:putative hydrolase of the HAD superfamily
MALVSSYEAFIFDYGGVLVEHQTDADQAHMAGIAGVSKDLFSKFYWAERPDYDKGRVSYSEYWEKVARLAGTTLTEQTIEELVEFDNVSWMQFDSVMWEWIDQLRAAGKRVAMLSNMPRELGEALKTRTQRLDSFNQVTLSYEVRSTKPEPAIYEHCLQGLGTSPEQTLFIDDRIANVQGAEVLGMRGVLFTSRDDMLLLLRT